MPPRRALITLVVLALLLAGAIVLRLVIGGSSPTPGQSATLIEIRSLRAVAAAIVGASLAVAGVLLQSLLRNPLASPDLLGLASGSGLGVMISVYLGYLAGGGIAYLGPSATGAAVAGAMGALAIVYLFSQRRGLLDPITLVLVGVVVSIICSAGTQLVRHLMPDQGIAAMRLLVGAISDDVTWDRLAIIGVLAVLGIALSAWCGTAMDAASLGDDEARSVGVPLGRLRVVLFIVSGLLTAGSVVLAGAIGFVGLICPHVVRLLAGPSHRTLVIGSALAGAILIVLADALVRAINLGSGRVPISVLTSLIGGPMLIWLLRKSQRGEV